MWLLDCCRMRQSFGKQMKTRIARLLLIVMAILPRCWTFRSWHLCVCTYENVVEEMVLARVIAVKDHDS